MAHLLLSNLVIAHFVEIAVDNQFSSTKMIIRYSFTWLSLLQMVLNGIMTDTELVKGSEGPQPYFNTLQSSIICRKPIHRKENFEMDSNPDCKYGCFLEWRYSKIDIL